MQGPRRELHLFFATENSSAVILYRAKKKLFRLISWNTNSNEFKPGQWIKAQVYPYSCAFSPDGKHFMSLISNGMWKSSTEGDFTAISHPPYFTAIILVPEGSSYGGGGYFPSNSEYVVHSRRERLDSLPHYPSLKRVKEEELPGGSMTYPELEQASADLNEQRDLVRCIRSGRCPDLGAKYQTEGAQLFSRHRRTLKLLADFSDMEFEKIEAPYGSSVSKWSSR